MEKRAHVTLKSTHTLINALTNWRLNQPKKKLKIYTINEKITIAGIQQLMALSKTVMLTDSTLWNSPTKRELERQETFWTCLCTQYKKLHLHCNQKQYFVEKSAKYKFAHIWPIHWSSSSFLLLFFFTFFLFLLYSFIKTVGYLSKSNHSSHIQSKLREKSFPVPKLNSLKKCCRYCYVLHYWRIRQLRCCMNTYRLSLMRIRHSFWLIWC